MEIQQKLQQIPIGYSEVHYEGKRYGLSRTDFNNGKSLKIYAKELGGNGFISFNYYMTTKKNLLKPCEMPIEKVIQFIHAFQFAKD